MSLLKANQITKEFSGVRALKGVDFSIEKAQGLALVGENGAGKSTLMKVISGVYPHGHHGGDIHFDGKKVQFTGTKDAAELGIAIIHQELNLFPELTVAENIFLSHLPQNRGVIDFELINKKTQALLDQLDMTFRPDEKVIDLNTGHQQMVEIAKALSFNAKILILDEPTSSLTTLEIKSLFKVIKKLQAEGLSFIYISHKLDEVFELCQKVTVLRDGESVFEGNLGEMTESDVISHMVGRELSNLYPPKKVNPNPVEKRDCVFEVKNWSAYKYSEHKYRVKDFSFKAYRGEILGISGIMGAGRTDLVLSVFGSPNYKASGSVVIDGKETVFKDPGQAIKNGLGLVTEDRKRNGLHLDFSIADNICMSSLKSYTTSGLLDKEKKDSTVESMIKRLLIKIPSPQHAVKTLSGGNQQKVAIAKWLATGPKVLFLDEPTRGIDVGAKFEIYSLLNQLVDEGVCVIIVSSELPEIMGMCDRVLVMREGELAAELQGQNIKETEIMNAAVGVM
tara:strand:- start:37127 stop:38650 length:1524 start_codon:yes stop_codon:yes gene_type:complete